MTHYQFDETARITVAVSFLISLPSLCIMQKTQMKEIIVKQARLMQSQ
jgi:hypothetical protein